MTKNKKIYTSMIIDWIAVLIFLTGILIVSKLIHPYERQFKLEDVTISHPYKGDTIKMVYLIIVFMFISVIIITTIQFYKKNLKYNYHQAIIGMLLCVSATSLFVNIIKVMVGRYRPDFISVCDVDFSKVEEQYRYYQNITNNNENYGPRNLFNTTICRASRKDLYEERKSFPSGHSSFAFSIMTYLALYIAGQIHLLDKKSYVWKYLVVCLPFILAMVVPLSRVMDYRHHWQDVTIGSLIGIFFGIVTYFYYYPSLRNPNCDIPHQRYENNTEVTKQELV